MIGWICLFIVLIVVTIAVTYYIERAKRRLEIIRINYEFCNLFDCFEFKMTAQSILKELDYAFELRQIAGYWRVARSLETGHKTRAYHYLTLMYKDWYEKTLGSPIFAGDRT